MNDEMLALARRSVTRRAFFNAVAGAPIATETPGCGYSAGAGTSCGGAIV